MKKARFCTYIILVFTVLVWPFDVAGKDPPISSVGKEMQISESFMKDLQKKLEALQRQIEDYYDTFEYIPAILLLNAILATYCWSVLNKKFQCVLCFILGFTLFGPLISFQTNMLNLNYPEEKIRLICGLVGGVMAFISYWVTWMFARIFLFLGGVLLPILIIVFFGFINFFGQIDNIDLIVAGVISIICGFVLFHLEQYKVVQVVTSAIGGAISIVYLLLWTDGLSNFRKIIDLQDGGLDLLNHIKDDNQTILVIVLTVTGIIVQAVLLAINKRKKLRSAIKSKDRVSGQVKVT